MRITVNPEVGDVIVLKEFSFNNKAGGTGLSNWEHNEKFNGTSTVRVIEEWNDYECGQRGKAFADPKDKNLIAYLKRNAKSGYYDIDENQNFKWVNKKNMYVIYWSEFDIVKVK